MWDYWYHRKQFPFVPVVRAFINTRSKFISKWGWNFKRQTSKVQGTTQTMEVQKNIK